MTAQILEDVYVDAFGTHLEVGDTVLHFFNHASTTPTICLATVVGATSKKVRIEIIDVRQNGIPVPHLPEIKLTKPQTLVKHAMEQKGD